jgi:GAF domain-containing protein
VSRATAAGGSDIRAGLRVAVVPHGAAGAFAHGMAELADALAMRSAVGLLRGDDIALLLVDRETDELALLAVHRENPSSSHWPLREFPATRHVLDHRIPGQVVTGDAAGDPAELAMLETLGRATMLIVPVVFGGRELAVLEVFRALPQAFTARQVDRARIVAQQSGAVLDPLT